MSENIEDSRGWFSFDLPMDEIMEKRYQPYFQRIPVGWTLVVWGKFKTPEGGLWEIQSEMYEHHIEQMRLPSIDVQRMIKSRMHRDFIQRIYDENLNPSHSVEWLARWKRSGI